VDRETAHPRAVAFRSHAIRERSPPRRIEVALRKTLGVTRAGNAQHFATEFALLGLVASERALNAQPIESLRAPLALGA